MQPSRQATQADRAIVDLGLALLGATSALLTTVVAAAAGARSVDRTHAAAVYPPWWSRDAVRAAAAASGHITSWGPLPLVVVVRNHRADVGECLRRSGALFSLDPGLVRMAKA